MEMRMNKPKVQQGSIVATVEVEKDGKHRIRRLRQILTDAVGPNASVPDEDALAAAIDDALSQTKDQDIDGIELLPLPEGDGCGQ